MPTEHLVSNFNALLENINTFRPKRDGKFITRVIMTSPPSQETLKIDPNDFPFDDYDRKSSDNEKKKKIKKSISELLEAETATN